jgi:aerobic carbon-monoxide dehydrogenase medium subunit
MFPADFAYARARSLDEALDLLDEAAEAGEEAKLIAGGQSLLPMMKLRLAAPQVLIDIADLKELKSGGWYGPSHTVGALTTYRQLGRGRAVLRDETPAPAGRTPGPASRTPGLVAGAPALADALAVLADPQVRARGTIGGAVAHGDPAADLPAVLLALDAQLIIASRAGRHEQARLGHLERRRPQQEPSTVGKREITLDDFLQGIYATDLAADEVVTHVRVDIRDARGSAYEKFPHPASHLPLAGVCAVVRLRDGLIDGAAIAVTGISPRPYRARETERRLAGAPPTPETLASAAAHVTVAPGPAGGQVTLLGDQHASGPYRAHLAEVLARRALGRAIARAERPSA